jgi:hypothetical protein
MSEEKRRCIFTNEIADTRMIIPPDGMEKHNWARQVPCSKKYLQSKKETTITNEEFKQIELFFQLELAKAKVAHYSNKLVENMEFFKAQKFAKEFEELKVQPLYVSEEEFDRLLKVIENPPEPNKKLKEGVKKHKEKFAQVQADIVKKEIARIADSFVAEEKSVDFVLAPDLKVTAEDIKEETPENDEDLWT